MAGLIKFESCEMLKLGDRVLAKSDGQKVDLVAALINKEEQAAICFWLLGRLEIEIAKAPLSMLPSAVSAMRDTLSTIAEYPGLNQE